jgi:uncharacterized membrane protein
LNPFDLKAASFLKHGEHVVFGQFPIALCISSLLFDLLAVWRQSRALAMAAYNSLMAASLSALPRLAAVIIAWR